MFFGRTLDLQQIAAFIDANQSISVIGPRKIGKTSLLFHLMREEVWPQFDIPENNVFAYLDCETLGDADPADIFRAFADELAMALDDRGLPEEPALATAQEKATRLSFETAIRKLSRRDLKVVLILDEFERLSRNARLDINFFNALRAAAGRYPLVFVTCSARPLIELIYAERSKDVLSSPFFNIFAPLFLGLLSDAEARQMLREPIAGTAAELSDEAVERLLLLAGGHPFVLEVVAFHTLALREDRAEAERRALRELESHFRYYWENLTPSEQEVLRKLPQAGSTGTSNSQLRTVLRGLCQKCLLVKDDAGYHYPLAAWGSYVLTQAPTAAGDEDGSVGDVAAGPMTPRPVTITGDLPSTLLGVGPTGSPIPTPTAALPFIGNYEVHESVGFGAVGEVYRGRHPRLDRTVAIKVLRSRVAGEDDLLRRFQQEARVIASLRHPHIVQVFDFGEINGTYYMVMEFIEGMDLMTRLRDDGALPLYDARELIRAVAAALDCAHDRDLIHRDVKPSNVLLETDVDDSAAAPRPVLTDFGLSKMLKADSAMTETGTTIGTPAYMAPELIMANEQVDKRVDIYSLGVMAYELVTGKLPYNNDHMVASMWGHLQAEVPDPRAVKPALPESVAVAIQRAMAKDREERFDTAGDLADALG